MVGKTVLATGGVNGVMRVYATEGFPFLVTEWSPFYDLVLNQRGK